MAENMSFSTLHKSASSLARCGSLKIDQLRIETPTFIAATSRGAVPHLTPDQIQSNTGVQLLYYGIEDFVEMSLRKKPIPILAQNQDSSKPESRLTRFVANPSTTAAIVGPRRSPAVEVPAGNNLQTGITVRTSQGFIKLDSETYVNYCQRLRPDIMIAMADLPYRKEHLGKRRRTTMASRTEKWIKRMLATGELTVPTVAPLLPLEAEEQHEYLELFKENVDRFRGLASYPFGALLDHNKLPEPLQTMPRFGFLEPESPHEVLHHIRLGFDAFALPFVESATDAGVALEFEFPAPDAETGSQRSIGTDMWARDHEVDMRPLKANCQCSACARHARAYVRHMLHAKEMTAWTLLQIHNFHVISLFFHGVRASIANGSFEGQVERFSQVYAEKLPRGTGAGPRLRGYQRGSSEFTGPMNDKAFEAADID